MKEESTTPEKRYYSCIAVLKESSPSKFEAISTAFFGAKSIDFTLVASGEESFCIPQLAIAKLNEHIASNSPTDGNGPLVITSDDVCIITSLPQQLTKPQ